MHNDTLTKPTNITTTAIMDHTVSIRAEHSPYVWIPQATFVYHVDARAFAKRLSDLDHLERPVRIESVKGYVDVYYRRGEED